MSFIELNNHLHFLIIDQSSANTEALSQHLKKLGYSKISTLNSGLDTLNLIGTKAVDFIFCRMNLLDMSAIELFLELKSDLTLKRVPFSIYSDTVTRDDEILLEEFNVDSVLTLPFSGKDIAAKITSTWSKYIIKDSAEYKFETARRAFLQNNFLEAAEIFESIISSKQIIARSQIALGRVYQKQKKLIKAKEQAFKTLENHPSFVQAYQLLGELYLETEEPALALENFTKALNISPKNPFRYQICGDLLCSLKMWLEALNIYEIAAHHRIETDSVLEGHATVLARIGRKKESIKIFKSLVQRDPKNEKYVFCLAMCAANLGQNDQAAEYFRLLLSLDCKNKNYLIQTSIFYCLTDKFSNAKQTLKSLLTIDSNNTLAQKILQKLESPSLTKIDEEKQKLRSFVLQYWDEHIEVRQRVLKRFDYNAEAVKRLKSIATSLRPKDSSKPQFEFKKTEDSSEVEKSLQGLGDAELRELYIKSLKGIRVPLYRLISEIFDSISSLSSQIVQEMIENIFEVTGKTALVARKLSVQIRNSNQPILANFRSIGLTDDMEHSVQIQVEPIFTELQFHDILDQSFAALKKCYQILMDATISEKAFIDLQKSFPTIDERSIFERVRKSFLVSTNTSLPTIYIQWQIYISFLQKSLDLTLSRLKATNESLQNHTDKVLEYFIQVGEIKNQIHQVFLIGLNNNDTKLLNGLKETFFENSSVDISLRSIVSLAQHSVLIADRVKQFKDITKIINEIYAPNFDRNNILEVFKKFGLDFKLLWKYCELCCSDVSTQKLLSELT